MEGPGGGGVRVNRFETRLALVCDALNRHDAEYLVVGATAMQLWGTTRSTRDVDLLIRPTRENAARVLAALSELGAGLAGEWLAEEVASKPVTIIGDDPRVDLLTVAWSVRYDDAAPDARTFEVEGVPVPVASIDHLIESKRTGRLQDEADIEVLERIREIREGG